MRVSDVMELSGPEKAVLMLLSLDEATATPILSEMDAGDVRKLREAASNMRAVPATALEGVDIDHAFLDEITLDRRVFTAP